MVRRSQHKWLGTLGVLAVSAVTAGSECRIDPPSPPPPCFTCSGQTCANHMSYTFVFESSSGCVSIPVTFKANSSGEAMQCAADQGGKGLTAIPIDKIKIFFFAQYAPKTFGGFDCRTVQLTARSTANAKSCLLVSSCSSCTHLDITDKVALPDGSINGTVLTGWCMAHPAP